jgi:hypothetical protein
VGRGEEVWGDVLRGEERRLWGEERRPWREWKEER